MDADGVSMVTETSGSGVDGMATGACGVGVGAGADWISDILTEVVLEARSGRNHRVLM